MEQKYGIRKGRKGERQKESARACVRSKHVNPCNIVGNYSHTHTSAPTAASPPRLLNPNSPDTPNDPDVRNTAAAELIELQHEQHAEIVRLQELLFIETERRRKLQQINDSSVDSVRAT